MKNFPLRIGLFGIGLEAYWSQFEGLENRLKGYLSEVADKLDMLAPGVVNLGLIDSPLSALCQTIPEKSSKDLPGAGPAGRETPAWFAGLLL